MFAQGRRDFLKAGAALGSTLILPGGALAKGAVSANNRLNLAYIGVGGRSRALLRNAREGTNVVALCDVDKNCLGLETVKEVCPKARFFTDYRKMLDAMENEIDAVVIATPNHTHFPIAMHYARAKKHLYVEKPITTTIWEARELAKAQREYGITTQMGNQGRSFEGPCLAREWYQAGMIGDFVEAHVWSGRSGAKSAIIPEMAPVPATLDWDLWIGPAKMRAFSKSYLKWRSWWDFGGGPLYDIGCHTLEAPLFALDSLDVVRVEAKTSERWPENPPKSSVVEFHIKPKEAAKAVKIFWYDGGKMPDTLPHLEPGRSAETVSPGGGAYIVGTKAGMILPGMRAGSARLAPEAVMKDWSRKLPEKTVPRNPAGNGGHMQIWIDAITQGTKANSDFADYAVPLAEIVMLGVIAKRTGQPVDWDADNMRITSSEKANELLRPYVRNGWEYSV